MTRGGSDRQSPLNRLNFIQKSGGPDGVASLLPWSLADTCTSTLAWRGHDVQWWCIRASVRGVLDRLASLAPSIRVCCHSGEALGVDAWVYFSPWHAWRVGCLLPEVLVVYNARRPNKLLVHLCNGTHVGHEVWLSS